MAAPPAPPVVRLAGASRRFGTVAALDRIDLEIAPGEFLALAGHNGAGKSTLFRLMLGLLPPSAGAVRVFGADPCGRAAAGLRRRIGFLPENVSFAGNLTGREMLRFFARLKGAPAAQCDGLLEAVGLDAAAARRVKTWSRGMRQRLGLAQMLLGAPDLLILDEPTTGLDPESRRRFYDLLAERRRAGATIILSSHTLPEIEEHADRIALLRAGRLVACGTVAALQAQSGLPVRIRIQAPPAAAAGLSRRLADIAPVERCNGQRIELRCRLDRQAEVLRRLGEAELGGTVDIRPPRLEDIYHRHMAAGDAPAPPGSAAGPA